MADHDTTDADADAETPEAFLASREQFWNAWKRFVILTASGVVLVVIGLAVFVY